MPIFSNNTKIAAISLLVSSTVFSSSSQAADYYDVVDLGSLGNSSEAFAINNANDSVGNTNGDNFSNHSFVYRNDEMTDLGYLPVESTIDGNSFAFGINNSDIAVGYSSTTLVIVDDNDEDVELTVNLAVFYDINNLIVNTIPSFSPESPEEARAIAINDNNLVVGFGKYNDPDDEDSDGNAVNESVERAFFYDIDTDELSMVGALQDDVFSNTSLRAVNNDGYAVGVTIEVVDGQARIVVIGVDVTTPEIVEKYEIFGGSQQQAWDINSNGIMVGSAVNDDNTALVAFSYDINTEVATNLGVLNDSFPLSTAYGINDINQIVGLSKFQNSVSTGTPDVNHAFLYEDGVMKDLDLLIGCNTGWRLNEARAINDSGVIVGTGILNGEKRAFMLTERQGTAPVCDEDDNDSSSGSLPVIGLLGLFFVGLFRRKN